MKVDALGGLLVDQVQALCDLRFAAGYIFLGLNEHWLFWKLPAVAS